jgi:predicted PurR-regulated permease PerM
MTARSVLVALSLVVLTLLAWNLRWVLLVLFGAVVMAVALDVLIQSLQQRTKLERPAALAVVLGLLLLAGAFLGQLLYRNCSISSGN